MNSNVKTLWINKSRFFPYSFLCISQWRGKCLRNTGEITFYDKLFSWEIWQKVVIIIYHFTSLLHRDFPRSYKVSSSSFPSRTLSFIYEFFKNNFENFLDDNLTKNYHLFVTSNIFVVESHSVTKIS